eukprot:Awhi_evm1s14323
MLSQRVASSMRVALCKRAYSTAGVNACVVIDHDNKDLGAASLHAISAAAQLGGSVTAFIAGTSCGD